MNLLNTRDTYPQPMVAQGLLLMEDSITFETLQRDPNPLGTYQLIPHEMKGGTLDGLQTWVMVNPDLGCFAYATDGAGYINPGRYPMRFGCCIHYGNFPQNSEGCIMIGTQGTRNLFQPSPSIGASRAAFKYFVEKLGGTGTAGHTLTISEST